MYQTSCRQPRDSNEKQNFQIPPEVTSAGMINYQSALPGLIERDRLIECISQYQFLSFVEETSDFRLFFAQHVYGVHSD